MSRRPRGYGIGQAVLDKQLNKFNEEEASNLLVWLRDLVEGDFAVKGNLDNFQEVLKNGVVLC